MAHSDPFSHRALLLCCFLLLGLPTLIAGQAELVPRDAKVTLSADRDEYFLGENVLIHFTLSTTGDSFRAEFGGDYRGAARALRYQVSGTDTAGNALADPFPSTHCFGGMGGEIEVTSTKPFHKSLAICRYLRFEKPGTYCIRITHDFGWQQTDERPYPSGEINLTVRQPSPQKAAELVADWLATPTYSGSTWGEKSEPHADFAMIRNVAYVAALNKAAVKGNAHAITGLGSIDHVDATRALVQLLTDHTEDLSPQQRDQRLKKVCSQLAMRMPDPYLMGELEKRNVFEDTVEDPRKWLIARAWRDEFAKPVHKLALDLLTRDDPAWIITAAYFLECLAQPTDAEAVTAALTREVQRTVHLKPETRMYPRPRGACLELQRTARILLNRGVDPPPRPDTAGEAILFLIALREDNFRPADWVSTCDRLLTQQVPYVQEQVLKSLPDPMPEALKHHLEPIIRDGDIDAAIEACHIVERQKLNDLSDAVLHRLRTAKENWLFNAADNAAAVVADYERLQILVSRIDEPNMMFSCLDSLKSMFSNVGGGGHNSNIDLKAAAARIKPMWQAFIDRHADELKAGKRFRMPHPEITADMVPRHYTMTIQDGGGEWPPRSQP